MEFKNYFKMYSYLKIIMELLNKENDIENFVIGEIFNDKIKDMNDEDIKYMYIYSALFENRLLKMDNESRKNIINVLYESYIKSMIVNFSNGNIDAANVFYNMLDERVKMISEYYGIYDFIDTTKIKKIG